MDIVVAITGASGVIYGIRLVEELRGKGNKVYLIVSENAKKIMGHETNHEMKDIVADEIYGEEDMESKLASGSFSYDAMVIVPCSLKTLSAIASGFAHNLITRTAMCCMKEGRKLIVVPRETPLDLISLDNMVRLRGAGAVILPAMPAFYHHPTTINDLINYVVGKILDQLGIEHNLYEAWKQERK